MTDRLIQSVALVVLVAGLGGAYLLTPTINQQRLERQLTYDMGTGDGSNPAYTFVASLGSFRGIAVNILWQRAEQLKQDNKFYEANKLAEFITTLQPRFPEAWNFHGWNMAYNISVKCKTAEERWDWVRKGMDLIRDRGIPNNPNAVVLYRSLAWILGHKMTGQTDDMHWYYKARWCETWEVLLGRPDQRWTLKPEYLDPAERPPDEELDPLAHGLWLATENFRAVADAADRYLRKGERDRDGQLVEQPDEEDRDYNASNYFTTLSPDTLRRFYKDNPGVEGVVKQLEAIKGPDGEALGLGLNTRTLRAIGRIEMYEMAGYPVASPIVNNPNTLGVDAVALFAWRLEHRRTSKSLLNLTPNIDIEAQRAALQQREPDADIVDLVPMINLLRALALVSEYHMDPAYMLWCMEEFGPLDWRHPAAHACYWTALGTRRSEQWTKRKDRIDFVNANRATIHALQHLSHNGKVTFRPEVRGMGELGKESINNSPDVRMIPAYVRAWENAMDMIERGEFGDKHKTDTYANGHENFLHSAVYLYYLKGREDLARKYFQQAKERYAGGDSPSAEKGHYNLQLGDFARVRMEDDLNFQDVELILFWIRRAWLNGLADRDRGVMFRYLRAGKQKYDAVLEDRQTERKFDEAAQARQGLPPFEQLVLDEFQALMMSSQYSLPQKASIWELAAPLLAGLSDEQPMVFQAYAALLPVVGMQAQMEGWGEEVVANFRVPRGYQEWVEQNTRGQGQGNTPVVPFRPGGQP